MPQEVLLSVKDLRTEFFSSKTSSVTAIHNITFDIYKGEILGLVGESGCGKTTCGRTLVKLYEATSGTVLFERKDVIIVASVSCIYGLRRPY